MADIKIMTDHKWKNLLYSNELPRGAHKRYFDWMDKEEFDEQSFIKYRDRYYALDEFMVVDENNPFYPLGYQGYASDSYFSGVLIKLSEDREQYQIATYIS